MQAHLDRLYKLLFAAVDHARRPSVRECEHIEADRKSAQKVRDNLRDPLIPMRTVSQPLSAELRADTIRRCDQTDSDGEFEDREVEWLDSIGVAGEWEIDCHRMCHRFAA